MPKVTVSDLWFLVSGFWFPEMDYGLQQKRVKADVPT
jgi:hypothetical protein